ncbi:unnamed protein product [Didymodactylos carnosus]|uniref:Uncharacterized protein n=1 Tax=Didymodactylos carnosus TaxID=1234261 RepID=A0A815I6B8_9BILA|nr:unnamed protein product [Didymodactylos carnosus]CAF1361327.1 unnamed protein product [Didymodactylos carnosus]CAF3912588.1 unnamed protein product [Didymodactylos carnosus]CAF4240129.1 unnamed protein product [Didymodactylos carnosus]
MITTTIYSSDTINVPPITGSVIQGIAAPKLAAPVKPRPAAKLNPPVAVPKTIGIAMHDACVAHCIFVISFVPIAIKQSVV